MEKALPKNKVKAEPGQLSDPVHTSAFWTGNQNADFSRWNRGRGPKDEQAFVTWLLFKMLLSEES